MMNDNITIFSFYHFVDIDESKLENLKIQLHELAKAWQLKGTIIIGTEGLNGTVSILTEQYEKWFEQVSCDFENYFSQANIKINYFDQHPFYRFKIKIKKEIVTSGFNNLKPNEQRGEYVAPSDWNNLIDSENTIVIDTRNDYEYKIGTFKNAINPKTNSFRDFKNYVSENLAGKNEEKNIVMFCTGGVRCEKSTSLLNNMGFKKIFHLEGGILNYLEYKKNNQEENNYWQGDCFVFDNRVAVDKHLNAGEYDQCHACRSALNRDEIQSPKYQAGISCPHCYDNLPEKTRLRATERQKQMQIAKEKNIIHLGQKLG